MAVYKIDKTDIEFNLFSVWKAQEASPNFGEQELKDILDEFVKFVGNEVFSTRQISDEEGVTQEGDKVSVPKSLHKLHKLYYENGWFGLGFAEEIGGMPVPKSFFVSCASLVTGANTSWYMYPGLTRSALNVIHKIGTEAQKNLYIPNMMEGKWSGTMCLTEADAGSDVGSLRTTATPLGDGKYKINGVKIFISSGDSDLYENIIHLVLARTPEGKPGTKGVSLFIVPKYKIDDQGNVAGPNDVKCTKIEEKMGLHAQATCELTFGSEGGCEGYLIGNEFEGMANMFVMMNEARLDCGLQGESQANLAYGLTLQYAEERVQFGKEITKHPDVRRMLLSMRSKGRGMRAFCIYLGSLFDKHEATQDPNVLKEIALLTPISKAYCTDEGYNVCVDAVQIHGGYGYCREYGIEQFLRDGKVATIYEGTNGIQAIDFTMRKVMADEGKTLGGLLKRVAETVQGDYPTEFKQGLTLMGEVLALSQKVNMHLGKKMQSGDVDGVLAHATEFLQFYSQLIVSWCLLENARVANELLAGEAVPGDKKEFYAAKIVDWQFYVQNELMTNLVLGRRMLEDRFVLKDFTL